MQAFRDKLRPFPACARVGPYLLLLVLTFIQDSSAGAPRYWLYLAKMLLGLWCLWEIKTLVPEMHWALSWEAITVGVLVFILWVGLDPFYPRLAFLGKAGAPWNPLNQFGPDSALGWLFVIVRTLGSALIVPPIEEVCYRSFLYRYVARQDFLAMPLGQLHWGALVVTSLIFGFAHAQWLAGILCGLAFQWLVIRKGRLGDAMLAHAITNFLLGVWIAWKGAWQFW